MNKKSLLFLLLLALFMPWAANAQETLTVCDGTTTSSYAPIKNGGGSQTEFIYPASLLEAMEGGTITSVKFFSSSTSPTNYSNTVTVFVEEVASSTVSSSAWQYNQATATKVYEGTTLTVSGGELVIEFDTPFEYNGGNLCFNIWSASNTPTVSYYYLATSNSCGYDYYITPPVSSPYSTGSYLPKAEFSYTTSSGVDCEKPATLVAENVTDNSATLTWTGGSGVYNIELNGTIIEENFAGYSYNLTDLAATTAYTAKVQSVCDGSTPTSTWKSVSFTTPCGSYDIPYTYDFEAEAPFACWTPIIGVTRGNSSSDAHNGSYYLKFSGSTSNLVALPQFNEPTNNLRVEFWTRPEGYTYSSCGTFSVGYMTDITDASTFVEVANYAYNEWTSNTHVKKTVDFNNAPANANIAFRHNSGSSSYYWFADDVTVKEMPSCLAPTGLAANASTTSAELSWTANSGETAWTLYYKKTTDESYTEVANVTTNPYTLQGLDAASNYEFYVVANCSADDASEASEVFTFATLCETVTTFPWTENFNSLTAGIPDCWDNSEGTTTYGDYKWNYYATGHDGAGLRFNSYNNSNNLTNFLKTVSLSLPSDQLMQLSFWYKNPAGGDFSVYISTDGGATHETALATGLTGVTTWTEHPAISLADYAGQEVVIVFKGTSNYGSGDAYIYLDDVTVMEVPTCIRPNDLEVTATTTTTATLSWTAGADETAWQICLNGDETNLIMANSNPFIVEDLTASTAYTAKVRAYCSADDQSDWSNEVSFATQCEAIIVIDSWSEGFEDGVMPACWSQDGDATWTVEDGYNSNTDAHTGTYNAKITHSEDGNVTKLITPVLDLTSLNNPMLTFWYINRTWGIDTDAFAVYYRTASDAEWTLIEATEEAHSTWTEATYTLPNPSATYQIAFEMTDGYGYGVGIDDVVIEEAPTYTKHIGAHDSHGYYLISSPIGTVAPTEVTNMIDNTPGADGKYPYDLFRFDQSEDLEWQNYRYNNFTNTFNLNAGQGYLYANSNDVDLVFAGTAYSGNGTFQLVKVEEGDGLDFPGWNLVGNPFATKIVEIKDENENTLSFYTMTANGRQIVAATSTTVQPMEGVFVVAAEDGEEITFTPTEGSKGSLTALNLSDGNEFVDRAIVRFGQGRQLPKLQLDRNSSKLYIPQDGQDYAVVYSEEMGALPVNFKAENNGTYNLSLSSENVEFAYLHLIDNKTGNDVDLLQTPSYSFEAKTTDYESRFKLVFATGDNSNDNNFAFFSNGSFVINNEGAAELQVIDLMGRVLSSETINGCTNVSVNAAPGVYMLRLINGDNVKVQKVVVK